MKTNVYVDGFNLYYGVLKDSPYKWLDIEKLCSQAFPNNTINRIRYFTARVRSRPSDPSQAVRQDTYLKAIACTPSLTIHEGKYLEHPVRMPLSHPPATGSRFVEVIKSEEKGSDVNLASYLLLDAFDNDYEAAIVVSNDSDLATPIKLVRTRFHLKVVAYLPVKTDSDGRATQDARPSVDLKKAASIDKVVLTKFLASSQLSPIITDVYGTQIHKPTSW